MGLGWCFPLFIYIKSLSSMTILFRTLTMVHLARDYEEQSWTTRIGEWFAIYEETKSPSSDVFAKFKALYFKTIIIKIWKYLAFY